ncbi:hypothetical protein C4K36_1642 [Pseudomonas chlororaphis subsp. piscium]|nr:hypothetical protein C4K36_1642 [Pseudomonas chlororaphis subsp. piscium]
MGGILPGFPGLVGPSRRIAADIFLNALIFMALRQQPAPPVRPAGSDFYLSAPKQASLCAIVFI